MVQWIKDSTLGRIGRKARGKATFIIHQREICETRLRRSRGEVKIRRRKGKEELCSEPLSLPLSRRPRTVLSARNTTTERTYE